MMWQTLKNQWQVFLLAMSFFTRIPVKHQAINHESSLSNINRYFALVGILVGLLSGIIFYGASLVLPMNVAILIAMICSVLLTGALHEDGLADICDGFGGSTKEKKLVIMKDSAIGTYGTLALVLALLLKYQLLLALAAQSAKVGHVEIMILYFILSQSLSRVVAGSMPLSLPYARTTDSKMGQVVDNSQYTDFFILVLLGLLPLLFIDGVLAVTLVISMLICRQLLLSLFRWQIGGYTGDCLGASQQIAELVCYIVLAAFVSQYTQFQSTLGQIS
jgi:adenosylcobinamide-GDP ribazoletransferase